MEVTEVSQSGQRILLAALGLYRAVTPPPWQPLPHSQCGLFPGGQAGPAPPSLLAGPTARGVCVGGIFAWRKGASLATILPSFSVPENPHILLHCFRPFKAQCCQRPPAGPHLGRKESTSGPQPNWGGGRRHEGKALGANATVLILQSTSKVDFSFNPLADPKFAFYDQSLVQAVKAGEAPAHRFFRLLSLCHTVMPEEKRKGEVQPQRRGRAGASQRAPGWQ